MYRALLLTLQWPCRFESSRRRPRFSKPAWQPPWSENQSKWEQRINTDSTQSIGGYRYTHQTTQLHSAHTHTHTHTHTHIHPPTHPHTHTHTHMYLWCEHSWYNDLEQFHQSPVMREIGNQHPTIIIQGLGPHWSAQTLLGIFNSHSDQLNQQFD